jgi:hypothetical protein
MSFDVGGGRAMGKCPASVSGVWGAAGRRFELHLRKVDSGSGGSGSGGRVRTAAGASGLLVEPAAEAKRRAWFAVFAGW